MTRNKYSSESEMYPDFINWFSNYLTENYPKYEIITDIIARINLNNWLERKSLHMYFPEYLSYELKIDIIGCCISEKKQFLSFVECKLNEITLRDFSQILGYSKVILPEISIILSPNYIGSSLNILFNDYNRTDTLIYSEKPRKNVFITKWDINRKSIDTVISFQKE